MKPAGETQRSSTPATNQHLVIGRTLWCLMSNPAGYRANHHPPQCLQSSVGQKSKHCLPHWWHWLPTTRVKPSKSQKSPKTKTSKGQNIKSILQQFANYFRSWETEFLEWNWMSQNSFSHLSQNIISGSTLYNHPITQRLSSRDEIFNQSGTACYP